MGTGYVALKGNNEIEALGNLVTQIKDIYKEVYPAGYARSNHLFKYIDDNTDKNNTLKTFLSNIMECFDANIDYFADFDLVFDKSEKSLEIKGDAGDSFPTEQWVNLLIKTFPNLTFFFVGEMLTYDFCGMEWHIYEGGKCIDSEFHSYDVGDISVEYHSLIDEFIDCLSKLVRINISIWRLENDNKQLLKKEEMTEKTTRRRLEKISKKIEETVNSLYGKKE
jgi:hypothetical protein